MMRRSRKRMVSLMLCVSLLLELFPIWFLARPARAETVTINVTVTSKAVPGFYWCQHLDGHWSTYSPLEDKTYTAADAGGVPEKTWVKTAAEIAVPASEWKDEYGNKYDLSEIQYPVPVQVVMDPEDADPAMEGQPSIAGGKVIIEGYSGAGVYGSPNSNICGGQPGMIYPFPVVVTWQGIVIRTVEEDEFLGLEIEPEHSTIYVGDSQEFTVYANWRRNGRMEREVVPDHKLSWSSSQPSRAPVNSAGVVTGVQQTTTDAVITAYYAEQNDSVSATVKVLDRNYVITGDFDILPSSTINWRDSFSLRPKDFVIPSGCTYLYHDYRISKDGYVWYSSQVTSHSQLTSFTYATYPYVLGVGNNSISIRITANCAGAGTINTGWIATKTLTISGPANNNPPIFSAGFFLEPNRTGIIPDTQVVLGSRVNLRIIHDNTKDPPWPYDPDGDPITYIWLFSSSSSAWIRNLQVEYGLAEQDEAHYNLIADELGVHSVTVIARDAFGAESRRTVTLNVVPPNPIPVITGPDEVKESRPLPIPFSSAQSYSPVPGRTIDHSKDEWENLKSVYTTPGQETVGLWVTDSAGLRSLYKATKTFTVLPDEPPYVEVNPAPLAVRGSPAYVEIEYGSNDGDEVVEVNISGWYDANNNGAKDADEGFTVPFFPAADGTEHTVTVQGNQIQFKKVSNEAFQIIASRVGKIYLSGEAKEDYGKVGYSQEEKYADVTNQPPSVSFSVQGKNERPQPSPPIMYTPQQMMAWDLYKTNTTTAMPMRHYSWFAEGNRLVAGMGAGAPEHVFRSAGYGQGNLFTYSIPLADYGYGPNGIRPYRGIQTRNAELSQPILVHSQYKTMPKLSQYVYDLTNFGSVFSDFDDVQYRLDNGLSYNIITPQVASMFRIIRSNDTHIYIDQNDTSNNEVVLYALNKSKVTKTTFNTRMLRNRNGSYFTVRYWEWENRQSPYDFAIGFPKDKSPGPETIPFYTSQDKQKDPNWRSKAQSGNTSGASSTITIELPSSAWGSHQAVEVTGRTIYEIRTTSQTVAAAAQTGGSPGYEIIWRSGSVPMYRISTFDALTGEPIAHMVPIMGQTGFSSLRYKVIGDNLLIINIASARVELIEVNRYGEVVEQGVVNIPNMNGTYTFYVRNALGQWITYGPGSATCPMTLTALQFIPKDADMNIYMLGSVTCTMTVGSTTQTFKPTNDWYDQNINNPVGFYLVKISGDTKQLISRVKMRGDESTATLPPYDHGYEYGTVFAVNNATNEVYVRTWYHPTSSMYSSAVSNVVNFNTNTSSTWGRWVKESPFSNSYPNQSPYYINRNGGISGASSWGILTATNALQRPDWNNDRLYAVDTSNNYFYARTIGYGQFVGDGWYISTYNQIVDGYYDYQNYDRIMFLDSGTPYSGATGKEIGQLMSGTSMDHAEIAFKFNLYSKGSSDFAGMSFRMQDPRNRYAFETDGSAFYLSRYVNGSRTVLKSQTMPIVRNVDYSIKIQARGDNIKVYIDNVLYVDVTDTRFASGAFGPFSDREFVSFSDLIVRPLLPPDVQWSSDYAIWEEGLGYAEVRYQDVEFEDPENDPQAGNYQWEISHTPRFLNHQGVSALHGRTLTSPALQLDKVGDYEIRLMAEDDPHPDYRYPDGTFEEYRKLADPFMRKITVHRRPVAQFALSFDSNKRVVWNDTSYDPDRWISPTNYSTEDTGIDYGATRGILDRNYYYVTPSGNMVYQQLVTPTELGTYIVGLQVMDEYGAWSHWAEVILEVTELPPANEPPTAGFTVNPSVAYRGQSISVTSTATDLEDGPASALKMQHQYDFRNVTAGGGWQSLQSNMGQSFNFFLNQLGVYEIRQVVTDTGGLTAEATRTVEVRNRPPVADFTWSPQPVWEGDNVSFTNLSSDPDGDPLTYEWRLEKPGGQVVASTARDWQIEFDEAGDYRVSLTVSDGIGSAGVSRTIRAEPLLLDPDVRHTPEWLEHHQRLGHETVNHPKQFYSGEYLLVDAGVSDAPIDSVTAWLDTIDADGSRLYVSVYLSPSGMPRRYEGVLYDKAFSSLSEGLPQGLHRVHFRAVYANGTVKEAALPIEIIGHVLGTVNVHRLH